MVPFEVVSGIRADGITASRRLAFSSVLYSTAQTNVSQHPIHPPCPVPCFMTPQCSLSQGTARSSPQWPSQRPKGILGFSLPLAPKAKAGRVRQGVVCCGPSQGDAERGSNPRWGGRCSWAPGWGRELGTAGQEQGLCQLLVDTGMSATDSPPLARAPLVSREHSARAPNTECL